MEIIIHSKILIGMIVLACVLFATGITTFMVALTKENAPNPSYTSMPLATVAQTNGQSDVLILTPSGPLEDIVIGKSIIFPLSSIPKGWKFKATLRIFQKEIQGTPYKNNSVEVAYIDKISDNDELEWKELDVTQKIEREMGKNKKFVEFTLTPSNELLYDKTKESMAIFDGVAQLVVSKI